MVKVKGVRHMPMVLWERGIWCRYLVLEDQEVRCRPMVLEDQEVRYRPMVLWDLVEERVIYSSVLTILWWRLIREQTQLLTAG